MHSASRYLPTTQPRPCQPTWITFPFSTSNGTVKGAWASRCMRSRASRSASTSYSVKSFPFHSSHSRISLVYGHPAVPKSSRVGMTKALQCFAHQVIYRRLYLLNTRDVVGPDGQRKIREPPTNDFATVITEQGHGQHISLACLFKRHDDIFGSAAGGDG